MPCLGADARNPSSLPHALVVRRLASYERDNGHEREEPWCLPSVSAVSQGGGICKRSQADHGGCRVGRNASAGRKSKILVPNNSPTPVTRN